jgi:hypothetical protein
VKQALEHGIFYEQPIILKLQTMKPETNQGTPVNQDEDVAFERDKEPAVQPALTPAPNKGVGETTVPAKEDTLGQSDFPPLSDEDKQPKLPQQE